MLIGYHELLPPIGVSIFVHLFHATLMIHVFIVALLRHMASNIHSRYGISIVAFCGYRALIVQHLWVIIPGVGDACWSTRRKSNYHEPRPATQLCCHVQDIDVKRLAREHVRKTSCGQGISEFNDVAVSLNGYEPRTLRTNQYSRLPICRYCALTCRVTETELFP